MSLNCSTEFADLIFEGIEFHILAPEYAKEFLKISELGFGTYSKSSEVDLKLRLCISFVCGKSWPIELGPKFFIDLYIMIAF